MKLSVYCIDCDTSFPEKQENGEVRFPARCNVCGEPTAACVIEGPLVLEQTEGEWVAVALDDDSARHAETHGVPWSGTA